jgi:urease alpha subunit
VPERLADLVIWKPENFGTKPEMVLKSGVIVVAQVCALELVPMIIRSECPVDG